MNNKKFTKKSWKMVNSIAIPAGKAWYPFSEAGAPTQNQQDAYFPLRTYVLNNLSGEAYEIILDSPVNEPNLSFICPDGNSSNLKAEENIKFNTLVCLNKGVLETQINELSIIMRNY